MCPSNVPQRARGRASEGVLASAEDVCAKYLSRELQPPAVDALFNTNCYYATPRVLTAYIYTCISYLFTFTLS